MAQKTITARDLQIMDMVIDFLLDAPTVERLFRVIDARKKGLGFEAIRPMIPNRLMPKPVDEPTMKPA